MKRLLTLIVMVMLGLSLMAQSTGKISYQAVVRDGNNRLAANTTVTVKVTIGSYEETFTGVQTNANGLISLLIGNETGFDAIDWSSASITTEVTIGSETVTNTVPVTAVPYALYASDVNPSGANVEAIYNKIKADSLLLQDNIDTVSAEVRSALVDTAAALRGAIPVVNDGTLTITYGTETPVTFTANQAGNSEITIPAQVNADWTATSGVAEILNKPDLDDYATKAGDNTFTGDNTFSGHNTVFSDTVIVPQAVNQTTLGYTKNEMQAVSYKDLMFIFDSLNRRHDAELENLLDSLTNRIAELEDRLPFECGTSKVEDADGNRYATVVIGTQCWMKENLRTTKYANGTAIEVGTSTSTTIPYRYAPNGNESNVATYGYLYNWVAVMNGASSSDANPSGVQGICPTGWHVPSDEEWTQLTNYVSSQSQYVCGNDNTIAKALASTTGWNSSTATCAVGNIPDDNNKTGFSALPAGYYDGSYYDFGYNANLWSATEISSTNAYSRYLGYYKAGVYRNYDFKYYAFSVRCLRDATSGGGGETTQTGPTVTTGSVSAITSTSATVAGNVTADGNSAITACGVCYGTTANPDLTGNHVEAAGTTGEFTVNLTGLTAGTTYYVRAYATNSVGTAYGEAQTFTTTTDACNGVSSLTDIDENTYNTVAIGTQCWMKENLRTTKYANGTAIEVGTSTSTTIPYRYAPNGNESNVATYGYLYNWVAVMNGASSSDANPSGVQGICPTGWHVPSDEEWTQLETYVKSQTDYQCSGSYIAKALASTAGWNTSGTTCAVGNIPDDNNKTGFSVLPAGNYSGSYYNIGGNASLWSATEGGSTYAYGCGLNYANAYVARGTSYKENAFSVRCLRD